MAVQSVLEAIEHHNRTHLLDLARKDARAHFCQPAERVDTLFQNVQPMDRKRTRTTCRRASMAARTVFPVLSATLHSLSTALRVAKEAECIERFMLQSVGFSEYSVSNSGAAVARSL